jgi:hypothetical protein
MIRIMKTIEDVGYSSPACVEMEFVTEGPVLSSSTLTTASPEGYDVDNEEFNW